MDLLKRFFKFVIPSIVSMWIFSLYTMVDGIFVAWGVGEHALTAVNLSMPFTSLVFMVGILLATGTSTVISIALGQGIWTAPGIISIRICSSPALPACCWVRWSSSTWSGWPCSWVPPRTPWCM